MIEARSRRCRQCVSPGAVRGVSEGVLEGRRPFGILPFLRGRL